MPRAIIVYCSTRGVVSLHPADGAKALRAVLADGHRIERGLHDEFPRVFAEREMSGWTGEEALRRGVLRLLTCPTLPA